MTKKEFMKKSVKHYGQSAIIHNRLIFEYVKGIKESDWISISFINECNNEIFILGVGFAELENYLYGSAI